MKKFLDLKKSIVDSKNEPTLMQTYLDTIRSSCYKLATPHVSPRSQLPDSIGQCKQKQAISASEFRTPSKAQLTTQHSEEEPLDRIFQTLQSQCKSSQKESVDEGEIVKMILSNLDKLNRNKRYQESVNLIRKIILSMNEGEESSQFTNISNHSQMKKTGYIVQQNQSFEECEKSFDYSNQRSAPKDKARTINDTKLSSWRHEGNSIYIEDDEQLSPEQEYRRQQTERQMETHEPFPQSSSTQFEEENKPNEGSLYCIQEEQEQEMKSSMSSVSIIPEETIEFKKIIYMLDSNNTNKKMTEDENEIQCRLLKSKSQAEKNSPSYSPGSMVSSDLSDQELFNRTYTQIEEQSPERMDTKIKNIQQGKAKKGGPFNRTVKIQLGKKSRKESDRGDKTEKGPKNGNKEKGLNDIINMLSNKYNRTVKLGK